MPVQQYQECWNCGATNPKPYEVCSKCHEHYDDDPFLKDNYEPEDDEDFFMPDLGSK